MLRAKKASFPLQKDQHIPELFKAVRLHASVAKSWWLAFFWPSYAFNEKFFSILQAVRSSGRMRFNKTEVAALALGQPSHKFEKEGVLFVKEKQEGFFRRSESKNSICFYFYLFFVGNCERVS